MKWFLLTALFLSISAYAKAPASKYFFQGKDYFVTYELKKGLQEVQLHGSLLSGIVEDLEGFKEVQKLLRKNVDVRLIVNSPGGYQKLYTELAQSIKNACNSRDTGCEITTFVSSKSRCASACIPLFMVGDVRLASQYSSFGFHQSAVIPGALKIKGKAEKDLLKSGVDRVWLRMNSHMFQTLEVTYLNPTIMNGSNIVTRITD